MFKLIIVLFLGFFIFTSCKDDGNVKKKKKGVVTIGFKKKNDKQGQCSYISPVSKYDKNLVAKMLKESVIEKIERDLKTKSKICGSLGLSRNKRYHMNSILEINIYLSPSMKSRI